MADSRDATAKIRQIAIGRIIAPAIARAIVWRAIGGRSIIVFPITPILLIITVYVKDAYPIKPRPVVAILAFPESGKSHFFTGD